MNIYRFQIFSIKTLNRQYFERVKPIMLKNIPNVKFVDNSKSLIFDKKDSNILFYDDNLCQTRLKSYLDVTSDIHKIYYSIIELSNSKNGKVININNEFIRLETENDSNDSNVIIPMDIVSEQQIINEINFNNKAIYN